MARLRPRHPARRAVAARDQAVAGYGDLELHERAPLRHAQDVAGGHPACLLGAQPEIDRHAGLAQQGEPLAGHLAGWGRWWRTRRASMPAARIASAQGGVRPWCEQGSSVTYMVWPRARSPARFSTCASACGRPPRWVQPRAITSPVRLVGDDGADGRVGRGLAQHAPGQAQRQLHEAAIERRRRTRHCRWHLIVNAFCRAAPAAGGFGGHCAGSPGPPSPAARSRPAPPGSRRPRGSRGRRRRSARRRRGRDPSAPP